MDETLPAVVNVAKAPEIDRITAEHWGALYKILTPSMRPRGGRLGVNWMRVPPGRSACPFHTHQREDEVFFVLSGRGVLRYGDEMFEIGPGDCVSCPAGTGVAHQLANPFDEDLIYLAIGNHDPDEVCVYPDNGKVLVRSLKRIGRMHDAAYLDGEQEPPRIFSLVATNEKNTKP